MSYWRELPPFYAQARDGSSRCTETPQQPERSRSRRLRQPCWWSGLSRLVRRPQRGPTLRPFPLPKSVDQVDQPAELEDQAASAAGGNRVVQASSIVVDHEEAQVHLKVLGKVDVHATPPSWTRMFLPWIPPSAKRYRCAVSAGTPSPAPVSKSIESGRATAWWPGTTTTRPPYQTDGPGRPRRPRRARQVAIPALRVPRGRSRPRRPGPGRCAGTPFPCCRQHYPPRAHFRHSVGFRPQVN